MQRWWKGLRAAMGLLLLIVLVPLALAVALLLLVFPPTGLLIVFLCSPRFQRSWRRLRYEWLIQRQIEVWRFVWYLRARLFPPAASPTSRALADAAAHGLDHNVEVLLGRGADPNTTLVYGIPAVMMAAERGYDRVVRRLLTAGAHVNARLPVLGFTPLIQAARNGHDEAIRVLLEAGAELELEDVYGNDALVVAARGKHGVAVALLLDAFEKQGRKPGNRLRALAFATKNADNEMIRLLRAKTSTGSLPQEPPPGISR